MTEEPWNGAPLRPTLLEAMKDLLADISPRFLLLTGLFGIVWFAAWAASGPVFEGRSDKAKVSRATADIRHIAAQVSLFNREQNRYPRSLAELIDNSAGMKVWPEGGYLERLPLDPWGEAYLLVVPGRRGGDFDVISLGADNQPGGEGYDADLDQGSGVR